MLNFATEMPASIENTNANPRTFECEATHRASRQRAQSRWGDAIQSRTEAKPLRARSRRHGLESGILESAVPSTSFESKGLGERVALRAGG